MRIMSVVEKGTRTGMSVDVKEEEERGGRGERKLLEFDDCWLLSFQMHCCVL